MVLTAREKELDKVVGLDCGADDYMVKPFGVLELSARVRSLLRRSRREDRSDELAFDGIRVDRRTREVNSGGRPVELTRREFDIVAFLSKHPGQVFDRDRIHERVGGWENESDSQVVTEHIRRIRKKLAAAGAEPDPVETVWGMGYRWRA